MSKTSTPRTADPLTGYFSSVMLALLVSHTLASLIVDFAAAHIYLPSVEIWRYNTASGLFLGLVLADPVGAIIDRVPLRNVLIKFVLGFALGVIIQVALVTPFAGEGLSRFLFLFIATILVPVIIFISRLKITLAMRGTDLATEASLHALRVLGLSDRALIILLMVSTFAGFWLLSPDLQTTILCMAAVLAGTTLYVIFVHVDEEDPWDGLLPEDTVPVPATQAVRERLAYLGATIFPGAVLLGAAMHLALAVLLDLFPNVMSGFVGPVDTVRTLIIVAATGLGLVFFGMLAALGFGLAFVLLVGRAANWTKTTIRERCLRLVKVMCFRPIRRSA